MPYQNVPADKQDEMERCVNDVQATGKDKDAAIAICYASIVEGKAMPEPILAEMKIGARNSRADAVRLQAAHDALVEAGAVCGRKSFKSDNALKTISKTDDEMRVGNYIVLFGGRDLTGLAIGKNQDGSSGEYFSKNTDLESEYTKSGVLHVDFEHGQDPDGVGADEHAVLGYVDWKTAKVDERGVFVERVLKRRTQYMEWLETLISDGLVGNSSEAVRGQVKKSPNGEILQWPLKRDSLTVNPMEPRMLSENAVLAIKALNLLIPTTAEAAVTAPKVVETKTLQEPKMADISFTPEELAAMKESMANLETGMEEMAKSLKEIKMAQPAAVKAGAVQVTKDATEQPFESNREFLVAVKSAAFGRGEDLRLRPLKASGMSEGVPADGGYLIPPQTSGRMLERMYNTGKILSAVAADPVTGNTMTYNGIDETSRATGSRHGGVRGYWLAEAGTLTKSKPTFRQVELKLKKEGALVYATDEQLEDIANLESFILRVVPDELRFLAEDAIFEGDGVGKPLGFTVSPALVSFARETGSAVTYTDVVKMWSRRWAGTNNYTWYINQDVTPQLDSMYLASGIPANFVAYDQQGVMRIKGRPVQEVEYCSTLGTIGDIVLADLSQYQTITKGGIRSESSIHVQFLTDEMTYRFIHRLDGAPLWHSPLTPFKGTNTQSPFIALTTAS